MSIPRGIVEGTPELVAGSGPTLVQEWLLEADATAYRVVVVFVGDLDVPVRGGLPKATLTPMAYVMCNVAGGGGTGWGTTVPSWSVNGGGAWYRFLADAGGLHEDYVAEKFRLNSTDAANVTRLLRAALGREGDSE